MSLRNESEAADDQQIVRYLLELLPPAEADRLDEASVVDDEFAARLRIGEMDLIDGYVRGTLDADISKRFETHYLASPRRRKNVKFAVGFLQSIDRAVSVGTGGEASPPSTTQAPARAASLGTNTKLVSKPMIAAALVLVASGILLFQVLRAGNGENVAQRAHILEPYGREQPSPDAAAGVSTRVSSSQAAAAAQPALGDPPLALALLPQTRAVGHIPVLILPTNADAVRFELRLESNDFPFYRVGLEDPSSNRVVWRSSPIAAISGRAPSISVRVPSWVLKPQHYSLTITGRDAHSTQIVGTYTFQVARR